VTLTAGWTTLALKGGQRAHYWRTGAGPELLYLHSLLWPRDEGAFVSELSAAFDVIMPLAPGYEDLEELQGIEDSHDLALFYDDLLRELGVDGPLDVVGHSFGGMIGAELAAHFPERVRRLALIAPFGLWADDQPTADLARLPARSIRSSLSVAGQGEGQSSLAADPEEVIAVTQGMAAALKFLWPFPDQGLSRRLHRISAKTRIYWGQDDWVNPPSYAQRFAAAIDGATVEVIPGGHLLLQDTPVEMAERVMAFMASQ
jgi:pimeloyl-ACP methyl ester carboxylesterase